MKVRRQHHALHPVNPLRRDALREGLFDGMAGAADQVFREAGLHPEVRREVGQIGHHRDKGPGNNLVSGEYFGNTVSRQTFETQFILDVAAALDASPCHFYIISVLPDDWDSESVVVAFRLFPIRVDYVSSLTKQLQEPASALYDGVVTRNSDTLYGLTSSWDFSLKLLYSIWIVGGVNVTHSSRGSYLNQGSLQSCVENTHTTVACSFERYLTEDIERALSLEPGQALQLLFIKEADRQSVVAFFRLIPMRSSDTADWVEKKVEQLVHQISDPKSMLYSSNVTYRIDPTWGISQQARQPRKFTQYVSRPILATSMDAHERCKATRRCPRAWGSYNQSSSSESSHTFTLQEFRGGEHFTVPLFLDFEDWRRGTRGWKQSCRRGSGDRCLPVTSSFWPKMSIAGAHWNPFDFEPLGPSIPTARSEWNKGLVLNKMMLELDIDDQTGLIEEYESLVHWMDTEFQHGITDDVRIRSREEILLNITDYSLL